MNFTSLTLDYCATCLLLCNSLLLANVPSVGLAQDSVVKTAREEKGLSYSVGCQFMAGDIDRASSFVTFAITNPANRDELVDTSNGVYDEVRENGLTEKKIEDANTSYLKRLDEMLSNEQSLAGTLHSYQHRGLDMEFLKKRLEQVQVLSKEDVDCAAKQLLDANPVTVTASDFENAKAEAKVRTK